MRRLASIRSISVVCTSLTAGGVTTHYVNDAAAGLSTILTDGTKQYVFGPAGLAYAVDASNAVMVYHEDGLGSVRAITDGSGNVVQTFATDAFGNPANPPASQGTLAQPFGYTGEPGRRLGGDRCLVVRWRFRRFTRMLCRHSSWISTRT